MLLLGNRTTKYMTYEELLNFVKKSNDNEQVYYVYLDGITLYINCTG